jgi:DNA-binding PadR family transcriptional regulator
MGVVMKSSAEILPGTLDMLILGVLARDSLHGYGIAQRLRELSDDVPWTEAPRRRACRL